jgi:hypothetical protein
MSELARVLEEVRKRLVAYRSRELNEQDTKTALIDPVLRALGWHVGDLEEVSQEYKLKPQDKPVDYAFFLVRTPKLFLEAKARGQNLGDRKWAGQIMGYAAVAGVKWTVITNGDEYRIYNACVDVPVDEKMFRAVKISDGTSAAEETLELLSKERIRDNDIEVLWKAHFVDRQVRLALELLITAETDFSLIRLLKKKVTELSPKDIRASLTRLRVHFDFPIESEPPRARKGETSVERSKAARKAGDTRRKPQAVSETKRLRRAKPFVGVTLADVIAAGLLKAPLKLAVHYKGHNLEADLLPDGTVTFQGKNYPSCSTAAELARGTITGRPMHTNGWVFWKYRDEGGKVVLLDTARQEYLKRNAN